MPVVEGEEGKCTQLMNQITGAKIKIMISQEVVFCLDNCILYVVFQHSRHIHFHTRYVEESYHTVVCITCHPGMHIW